MELVKCDRSHWDSVLEIRNENRYGFGDSSLIFPLVHYGYMFNNHKNYLICVEDGEVIGFIGHVENDIRLAVKKDRQKRGVGKFMVEGFIEKHPASFAKIKLDNEASLNLFEGCGFKKKYYILEK